jgi:hypothetical protein
LLFSSIQAASIINIALVLAAITIAAGCGVADNSTNLAKITQAVCHQWAL